MRLRLAAPLLVILLLAGCVKPEPAPVEPEEVVPQEAPPEVESAPTAQPPKTEEPPAPASEPERPAATQPAPPAPAPAAAAPAPHRREATAKATTTAELGSPAPCQPPAPCRAGHEMANATLPIEEGGPERATLTANWTAATAAAETLVVEVTDGSGAVLATGKGKSPLALEVPVATLAQPGALVATFRPDAPGAAVAQEVTFLLALEYY